MQIGSHQIGSALVLGTLAQHQIGSQHLNSDLKCT